MKVYGVPEDSDVGRVIAALEKVCEKNSWTLSRWETGNKHCGWVRGITWAAHIGPRTSRYCDMKTDNIIYAIELSNREGMTKRSNAYYFLSYLLKYLDYNAYKSTL
jgi:hypothetical protein